MDEFHAQKSRDAMTRAVNAYNKKAFGEAQHFFEVTLDHINMMQAFTIEKSEHYYQASSTFTQADAIELAREALIGALEIDKKLDRKKGYASALNAYGNLHLKIHNFKKAEVCYRVVVDISSELNDFAAAAAASTNLAKVLARSGRFKEAESLLSNSLMYLKKIDSPRTEVLTRVIYLDLSRNFDTPPEKCLDVADGLTVALSKVKNQEFSDLSGLKEVLEGCVKKLNDGNSTGPINLSERFPWL